MAQLHQIEKFGVSFLFCFFFQAKFKKGFFRVSPNVTVRRSLGSGRGKLFIQYRFKQNLDTHIVWSLQKTKSIFHKLLSVRAVGKNDLLVRRSRGKFMATHFFIKSFRVIFLQVHRSHVGSLTYDNISSEGYVRSLDLLPMEALAVIHQPDAVYSIQFTGAFYKRLAERLLQKAN